ncbi:dynamin-related protein 4C-like protein isoform X1 [Tanacetum coccineum]
MQNKPKKIYTTHHFMGGGNISAAANMINNMASDHNAESLVTLTLAPLVSSYNDMIRPPSDAIHTLRCMNIIEEVTFPKIVVIGDKSSGKTSVIESLTGISLPRGVCTRVPLIIKLRHHRDPRYISQLHLEYEGKSFPINEDLILEEINLATDQIAGIGKAVSDKSLTLVVKKNNMPDLTIVDLPGLPVHDQSDCIYNTISGIIKKYIKLEEIRVIVNVVSATDDFLTCESTRLLSKYDKTSVRTLHVFTKSDKAFFEDMVAIVTNTGPDYVCVRNQIDNETHNEVRAMEANLFSTHHLLSNLDKTIVGIHVLAQKLVLI